MEHYEVRNIGENRGKRRIYLQGKLPERAGFMPGMKYKVKSDLEKNMLVLEVVEGGCILHTVAAGESKERVVSRKVVRDKSQAVIDIESQDLLAVFAGIQSIRVIVQAGRIFIMPLASELRAKERLAKMKESFARNEPLTVGAVAAGIGILDLAAHKGLHEAGVETVLAFANEIRSDCSEHAIERNPLYTDKTVVLTAPLQELVFDSWAMDKLPQVSLVVAGLPCSGASKAGMTKNKLEHPEDHKEVGFLVAPFIALVAKVNPVACVLENVPPYRNSASMSILRGMLNSLGYEVHETELDAKDWNLLEGRRRLCMIAVTKGIEFSMDSIERPAPEVHCFGEIMDDVPPDHSTWGSIDYLWSKKDRDEKKGSGFAPTVVDAKSTKLPVLNKSLHKRQSTGTFIQHPTNPNFYRIPTVAEHARAKGLDVGLVENTTQTFGHETLGQAISGPPFTSAFKALGLALKKFSSDALSGFVSTAQPVLAAA